MSVMAIQRFHVMDKINSLSRLAGVRALIIGDVMLDRYRYGSVERISPEAPVPVFKPVREKSMLGGAGNVAANLKAFGCDVKFVSRIGCDSGGKKIREMTSDIGVDARFLQQTGFDTIVKTRLIAGNNHLLRIDTETSCEIDDRSAGAALESCFDFLDDVDVVLLSDYAKGLLSGKMCRAVISECKKRGKKVIVDPKGCDYSKYIGAFLVKPNLKELSEVSGRSFVPSASHFTDDIADAARLLARKTKIGGVLVTLSEHGMLYVPASVSKKVVYLPTKAKEVFDVSGAGDTVLAAIGAALGAGFDMSESMQIANSASSVVVSKLGTATASIDEICNVMSESSAGVIGGRIVSFDLIGDIVDRLKGSGQTIGFTNGCFDCLHLGHLRSLREAKSMCDVLVVGVNSDDWIKSHKGQNRPIQSQETRISVLASLSCVDYIVVFDDETAVPLVRRVRPDVIAKEGYSLKDWPEGRLVRSMGGKAVVLKRVDGYSTTEIVNKMRCNR